MVRKINTDLLDFLSDDDIKVLIQSFDLKWMLGPFKQNSKNYSKYISQLGRLDSRSMMVKKNLPNIVYKLYQKKDINICIMISVYANKFREDLLDILKEHNITINYFNKNDVSEIIQTLISINNKKLYGFDIELFLVQLKMNGVVVEKDKAHELEKKWYKYIQNKLSEAQKEAENIKKILESNNRKNIDSITKFKKKIKEIEINLKDKEVQLSEKDIEIAQKIEETKTLSKELEKYKKELSDDEKIYKEQWKKQLEDENIELMRTNEQLKNDICEMTDKIQVLSEEFNKKTKDIETIKNEMIVCSNELDNKKREIDEIAVTQKEKIVKSDILYVKAGDLILYVEPGMCNTANKVYTSLEKYKMSIDTNLEQIGCKTDGEDLEDFFDSAIGVGLIPMLCGYGARKMAMGLVAARYGEIPTIISIPAGYKDIDTLNDKINNAETEVIVVEDLFGKMNEEIILPILRRDIDKQLLFCCESLECMKYVAKYFYNYIQILVLKKVSNKKIETFVFSDARDIFKNIEIGKKADIAKKVKRILKNTDMSDRYIQSRRDLLTYVVEIMHQNEEDALKFWFNSELKYILDTNQKEQVLKNLENNLISESKKLIGILQI